MSTYPVNYDHLAPTYNRRFEGEQPQPILQALLDLIRSNQAQSVLEVGCGTGFWLSGLATAAIQPAGFRLFGLDFSRGMLHQAQIRKANASLIQGRAERLPFTQECFDLIYCVHALHHFAHQQEFVIDCLRWLKPGGILALVGSDPHPNNPYRQRGEWYVYEYFDGVFQTDLARFPSWGQVTNWMVGAGYARIEWQPVEELKDSWQGRQVFTGPFLDQKATSQLALLSEADYQAGLDRIQAAIIAAQMEGVALEFHSVIHIDLLLGIKSPG